MIWAYKALLVLEIGLAKLVVYFSSLGSCSRVSQRAVCTCSREI